MPANNLSGATNGVLANSTFDTLWNNTWDQFIHVDGTWGGATLQIEFLCDNDTLGDGTDGWLPVADGGAFTADVDDIVKFPRKMRVRIVVSNATGTTDLDWQFG